MAIGNGSSIQPHNLVRMAELQKYFWTEPRSFDGQDEDHNPRTMDGDRQAMYCSPLFRGSRRPEAQGNASAAVSADSDSDSWADSIFKLSGAVEQHALHCKAFEEELNAWLAEMAEANRRCDEANANLERFYEQRADINEPKQENYEQRSS